MSRLNKNLLFIFVFIISLLFVSLYNFLIDPYGIWSPNNNLIVGTGTHDLLYIELKAHKNQKHENVILGGSDLNVMFPCQSFNKKYFKKLALESANYKDFYELLYAYLDLHSEVKNVFIVLGANQLFNDFQAPIPPYTGANYNFEEINKIFFSLSTLKKSTLKLFKIIFNEEMSPKKKRNCAYPNHFTSFDLSKSTLSKIEYENYIYIDKMIQLLKEKKINYKFIISPNNAIYTAFIYMNEDYKQMFENIKRFIVSKNVELFDMTIINKYTSTNLSNNKNFLYMNYSHPNHIFGVKFLRLFFDNQSLEDNDGLYILLNKQNIESKLKQEEVDILQYINENRSIIDFYAKKTKVQSAKDWVFCIETDKDSMYFEYKSEIEYLKQNGSDCFELYNW